MRNFIKVMLVMSVVWLGIFACTKHTDVNQTVAEEVYKASNQSTPYLQASSNSTQLVVTSPQKITINQDDGNVKISLNNGDIMVEQAGDYLIIAAPQVGRLGGSPTDVGSFRCWLTVNGTQVSNSNVLLNLELNTKDVIISQGIVALEKDDVVNVMMGATLGKHIAIEAIQPSGEPLVPSIILTMYKIN